MAPHQTSVTYKIVSSKYSRVNNAKQENVELVYDDMMEDSFFYYFTSWEAEAYHTLADILCFEDIQLMVTFEREPGEGGCYLHYKFFTEKINK